MSLGIFGPWRIYVFARYLGNIFAPNTSLTSPRLAQLLEKIPANGFRNIPPLTIHDLKHVLKEMGRNRCADTNGVLLESFIFGNHDLHRRLLTVYNDMIHSSCLQETWPKIMFRMLPSFVNC